MSMFLTRNELMELLRISPSTLTRYMKDENFPYFKFKGRVLFSKDRVEEFVRDYSFGDSLETKLKTQ
jgi:predicted DNA-binding transcriptional regulator AlpA